MLGLDTPRKWVKWLKKLLYRDERPYYEIRAINAEGTEFVVGWSSLRSGGTPMKIVKEHPEWHSPIVFDTKEGVLGQEQPWDDGHGDSWPPTY